MKRIKLSIPQRVEIASIVKDVIQRDGDGSGGIYHRATKEALVRRGIVASSYRYSSSCTITKKALEALEAAGLPIKKSDTQIFLELSEDFINYEMASKLYQDSRNTYDEVKEKIGAVWVKKEELMYNINKAKQFKSYLDIDEKLKPLVQEYNKVKQQKDKYEELYYKAREESGCVREMIDEKKNINHENVPQVIFMEEEPKKI